MDKGIGFNRRLQLNWLDATAALCIELDDPSAIRARLETIVGEQLTGIEARRKTIDVLLNIWQKSDRLDPLLHQQALRRFQTAEPGDRLWLHYGLTLLYYPFFCEATIVIGQLSRSEPVVTHQSVGKRLAARLGHLGSLEKSVQRVLSSLRDWSVLVSAEQRYAYIPQRQVYQTSSSDLEVWLLTCALKAHNVEEIHFADLLHLPALFPFRFTITTDDFRQSPQFEVQRQGLDFDMVRLSSKY